MEPFFGYSLGISSHLLPIYHELSQAHLFLTPEAKMRNHLAKEVLDASMLHLMGMYFKSLGYAGA